MDFRLPKSLRVLSRRHFRWLSVNPEKAVGKQLVVEYKENGKGVTRLGITVSRKYGRAHLRNRFKRIIREAFRQTKHRLLEGYDINIRPRKAAIDSNPEEIAHELESLIGKPGESSRNCRTRRPQS